MADGAVKDGVRHGAALEAVGLSAIRGGRRVFARCGFSLQPGQLAALRGPNGAGKSSLLRVLAGLSPAETGEAALIEAGTRYPLAQARDGYQERVAYAGHLDALKPTLTALENVVFWARLLGRPEGAEARAEAALARFGLEAVADAPAGLCSAGQKRRLGLARLAVAERPVWLLDEPTVSLDAASVEVFGALLAEHLAAGGLAVAATHIALPTPAALTLDMAAFAPRPLTDKDGDRFEEAEDPFLAGGDWERRR